MIQSDYNATSRLPIPYEIMYEVSGGFRTNGTCDGHLNNTEKHIMKHQKLCSDTNILKHTCYHVIGVIHVT